jgi:predicted NAD-dependent protein-ADP-ribosyltransferase YbiA (DUF1768 family)
MTIEDKNFPYDPKTQVQIETFYKKLSTYSRKDKYVYNQSQEGNLDTFDKKTNELVSSIPLFYYRSYTKDEFDDIEKERIEAIINIEEQIDVLRELLRKSYEEYKKTKNPANFMKYNNEMKQLELKKVIYRSPVRDVKTIESVEIRDIDFDKKYEVRKANNIYVNIYREFPLWKLYGKYTDSKEVLEVSIQKQTILGAGESFLKNGKIARIFNNVSEDDMNSFLSIYNIKDVIINNIKYSSPYQAFEAIRLETLKYEDLRNQLMKSKSIKYIRGISSKIKRALPNTKEVWKDILNEYYLQNKDLREQLLNTKSSSLVFANNVPYLGGIGLEKGSGEEINDPTKWKTLKIGDVILTPNIVGNVLMEIRNEMNEEDVELKEQSGGEVKESYKTDEEREKEKKAAIINYYKKY